MARTLAGRTVTDARSPRAGRGALAPRALLLAVALGVAACGGGTVSADAGSTPDGGVADSAVPLDAPLDASSVDAAADDAAAVGACTVRLSSMPRVECDEACDARLLLVSGGYYCTFQCTTPEECAPYGLDCIGEIGGACAPRCTVDADCPAGFYRCDPAAHFCDPYPV